MVAFSLQTGFEEPASALNIAPLDNALGLLQQFGFFKVVLPFLLIWAIFYAILLKTKVLGEDNQQTKNIAGGFAVGDKVPALYSLSALLSGQIAFAIPEEALNTMIALGLVLGLPLAVILFMTRHEKKKESKTVE